MKKAGKYWENKRGGKAGIPVTSVSGHPEF